MKKFRVIKPYKSISEWTIEQREFLFFWKPYGMVFTRFEHANEYCRLLNEIDQYG